MSRYFSLAAIPFKAEDLEIKYRKDQGLDDFVPTGAKVSSAGGSGTPDVDSPPKPVVLESTPETRAALLSNLSDLPSDSKGVIAKMEELKVEGLAPR